MSRPSVSGRFLRTAFAVSIGTGIGAGVVGLWSVAGAGTPPAPRAETAAATATATAPAPLQVQDVPATTVVPAPVSSPLTVDQATTVATQASPGRVVEVQEDSEPTGLRYDVTLLHEDGTATKIEVDAATGRVLSTKLDDDWDGS
jgi:hypothetical protein